MGPMQGAYAVESLAGAAARDMFIKEVFAQQGTFENSPTAAMPRSKVLELFAGIAEQSCKVRKADAVVRMQDWSIATFPAWQEVQIGILSGVTGTPKHVIGSEMVEDAESEWGVGEWQARLAKIKARSRAKWLVAAAVAVAVGVACAKQRSWIEGAALVTDRLGSGSQQVGPRNHREATHFLGGAHPVQSGMMS